jgi:protein gp37
MGTKIEYLTKTWNPMTGCSPISEGCKACWAKRMAQRQRGRNGYDRYNSFKVTLRPERLEQPLRWKKPQRVGVCFMGDLFHGDVPWRFTDRIINTIRQCRQHVFLVLTKRPWFARDYFGGITVPIDIPPNLHLGVSVENQQTADERIPELLQTPAAFRWVSYEPALGPVSFKSYLPGYTYHPTIWKSSPALDWVVIGAESGPKPRPMSLDWALHVVDDCKAAGVPVYVKQLHIKGKLSKDMSEWPPALRRRELPH